MNRFEQAVYDCMIPTEELLEETTKPLHRAVLLNFWRHVHLEASGQYDRIVAPDMMVDEPVYRVTWGANPAVRLAGEHLYEDKTSLEIEEVDPDEAITPVRVREIHREQLAKLEAERGENFWVLETVAASA